MKILHTVESYLPSRHGMQEVVAQLSKNLASKGHDVTIATSFDEDRTSKIIDGIKIVEFKITGNFSTGMVGETDLYQQFVITGDFDVVVNFAAQQWATDLMLPILKQINAKLIFVPTGFSGFYNPRYFDYFEKMKHWIKDYDANVFLSNDYRDINFATKHMAKNIVQIPNGADESEFDKDLISINIREKLDVPDSSFLILTIGSHTGLKGHDESIEIFKKSELRNSVLVIVGNSPKFLLSYIAKATIRTLISLFIPKIKPDCTFNCFIKAFFYNHSFARIKDKNKIKSVKLTRSDTIALYKSADTFLFPSNIECSPIVLFECCAAKLPFLVSDVGNSKEIIDWTGGGELMNTNKDNAGYSHVDIEKSSIQLNEFYTNAGKRDQLAKHGYNSFKKRFTWHRIAGLYEDLYKTLLR